MDATYCGYRYDTVIYKFTHGRSHGGYMWNRTPHQHFAVNLYILPQMKNRKYATVFTYLCLNFN